MLAIIRERDDLTTFAAAVEALGTESVFTQERGVTVLAPDDDAFALIGEDQLDALLADPDALADLISDHFAVGSVTTEDMVEDGEFTNASAETLVVEADGDRVVVGGATIVAPDLATGNGVVHIVDAVLTTPG